MDSRSKQEQISRPIANSKDHVRNNLPQQLLSFLEVKNSFFTPWSYDPNVTSAYNSNDQRYMIFQPGSFFTHQPRAMEGPEGQSLMVQPNAILDPGHDQYLMVQKEGTTLAQLDTILELDQNRSLIVQNHQTMLTPFGAVLELDQDESLSNQKMKKCKDRCVIG
ncbi:hypothetical protein E3N88_34082 [Mikania micrantha]|uniref:Uncharacterized protein n=1 Tax=Mikania micrantha TaxID=192012 RepID=A0A5N6MEL1_9ASTR|nr:hypothetical protein E3N88_34082 [Mikania micrantha]